MCDTLPCKQDISRRGILTNVILGMWLANDDCMVHISLVHIVWSKLVHIVNRSNCEKKIALD